MSIHLWLKYVSCSVNPCFLCFLVNKNINISISIIFYIIFISFYTKFYCVCPHVRFECLTTRIEFHAFISASLSCSEIVSWRSYCASRLAAPHVTRAPSYISVRYLPHTATHCKRYSWHLVCTRRGCAADQRSVSALLTYCFLCVINWLVISTTRCGNIATKQPATLRIAIRIVHSCMKFTVKWVRRKNIRICKIIDIDVKFIACKLCSLYFAQDVGLVTVN